MKIKKYMRTDFATVAPHTPLGEIARIFFETSESVLPVTEKDNTLTTTLKARSWHRISGGE